MTKKPSSPKNPCFKKVRESATLSERVCQRLEQAILEHKFKPNEKLPPECELAESFGVSRTVIREAIKRLESLGLVHAKLGSGNFVAPHRMQQIQLAIERFAVLNPRLDVFINLLDLCLSIEVETVDRLAAKPDPDTLARLRASIARLQGKPPPGSLPQIDIEFHIIIAEASENPLFSMILMPLRKMSWEHRISDLFEPQVTAEFMRRDHQSIYDAIGRW